MAQEQFIPDLPQQQQFIPQFDESTTRQYIKLYQKNPSLYNENYLTGLRNHAYHYNIPFYEGEFSVFEAIKQAGAGLVEGFTTLNLAEHPDNVYEQIARNVGHLVGFAPGIIANPMSRIKALRGIAATIPKRGIPLAVAEDVFEPYAKKIANKAIKSSYLAKTEATQEAVKFLTTPLAKDIATGAFRLGTASGISAWQGGVDAMVDSFFHGAVAGGVFKLIGNKINAQDPNAEKFARGLAGSLFMGLPSTLRGATMPEQIYEYLMGAYFGGNEVPWTKSRAAKLHTQNKKEAFANSKAGLEYNLDPKQFSTWKNAEPEVKKELVKMAEAETEMLASQRAGILGYELAEKLAELGHPQYIKQIEALKDPKKSGPEELAYNKELKKQGTLQKEVEKLNSEAKSLETDLYNTEFDFKRIYEKQDVELIKKRQEKTKGDVRWDFSEYSITPKGRVLLKSDKEFTKWQELFNKKIVKLNETEQRGFKADQVLQGQTLKTKKLKPKSKPLRKVILTTGSPGLESVASKAASKHNIQTVQGKLQGREMASKAGQGIVSQISEASLESVNTTLNKAFESANKKGEVVGTTPLKPETYKPEAIQRLRRNTFLIQNSNDIVIFGELNSSLDGLAKFNRVIGEVAINSKKPFYVYGSQGEKGNKFWWKYDPNKDSIVNPKVKGMFDFITTTPELGDRTAFFGPLKVSQGEAAEVNKLFSNQQYKGSKEMSRDLTAKETSLNFDIMDVGPAEGVNIILNSQLGSKINFGLIREKGFVKNYPNPSDRVNAIAKITETAIKNSKEFLETKNDMKGVFETRSQDWINSIEKTLPKNVKLTPKLKGELRAWLVMAKYGKPVNIFASDGKPGNTTLIDPETGISLNMKIKKRVAPESVIDEIYKKYEGEAVKPTQPAPLKPETIKPNVTNFPMNFKDGTGGRKMRPEFKGKSTMDLIESGDRTATSRSLKEQANKPVKKGDIVEMYDKNTGKRILVRATTDLYSLDKVTPEQWSQLEGWAPARHAELLKKGYKQFRFELIKPDSKPATHPRYGDYTPIEISSENINNILNTNKSLASKLEAPNLFGVIAKKGTSLDPSIVNKIASDYNKRYKTPEGEKTQISNLEYAGQIGAREIFKADVNGKTALFYRSSSGTSGDYKNRIMPFMGIGGKNFESPWFIKKIASRKDYEGGLSFYTKSIQEAAKKLDSKFKVPKDFVSGREQLMNILDKSQAKKPRYTQSKAGVRHVPELTGKDLTNTTKEVKSIIENTEGVTLRSGHKAVWFGPEDYVYTGAKHKAKEMPNNIKELKNEVEDALGLPRDYYDSVLMNKLPKGTKIGAHRDAEGIFRQKDGTIGSVGVLSLGGTSVIDIQKPYGKSVEKHTIKSGDVYELPAGQFQATGMDHFHAVGPSKTDRLSLTFRRTKFAPELTEPVSQPAPIKQQIKPTAGPKITAGPKNGYIDSVLFNGQDVELIRFEQKASHYLESELTSKGENKYKTYEEISEKAKEMKKNAIKNIVKDMEEMHNMHLWGGEGDKDRLVFVKYHPMTDTVKLPTDKKFTDMLNETVKYGKENYGLTREQEIRGMKSMLKYHEDINGLPMNQFIGKDGFIDNTVKMNKRLPVILNSGWRGDKALMNTLGLNLSNKGNFKAIIVKTKKALKDLLELTNSEMEQIRDGATLSEMKTMDALHLDRGSKYVQGNEKSIVMDGPLMLKHMVHNTSPELSEAMRNFKTNNPELGDGLNFIIYDTSSKQTGNIKAGGYKFERGKTKKKIIKTGFEIEQEWNTYVDTPNPTDPTQLGSKLIIRRNDAFLKKDKKTGKMVDMFDPVRSKIQFANTMTKEGKGNYIYNETANRFEDIIKIETTKNELLVEGAEIFEIDPGSFRYNYGVYDGPSNLGIKNGVYKGIPMPKQTLILPNAEMKNVSKEIPLDFFDTLVGESFKGTKEANTELTLYKKELAEKGVAIPGTEFEIVKEHFHNMGVKEIQDILTKPEYEKLSQEMILEMMNVSREAQERLMLEGESFYGNITDSMQNIAEFTTTADNIIKHASALGREALPLFHGKYTKEFVEKAVENWLIDKVMSPRVKNSIKGRLRPYTEFELDVKYPEFDSDAQAIKKHGVKADELVVLGDLYFDTPFYNPLTNKWSTLQKVWNKYQKSTGFEKNEYKSLFDGLTVRIPQDSASGAQVLRFAGFSGIKDHGILIHGRAMEKLGGADLDADSAFMYFGGRRADGSGEGMKQEWLQMYKNQKDEFTSRGEVFPTDIESPGSRLTARFANDNNKPYIVNPTGKELADFIKRFGIKEINVAGSRPKGLKVYPDKDVNITKKNIEAALKEGLKDVEFVRSGGQLGADMIGLEVARLLGKKTRGVAPPGYLQGKTPAKDILKSFGLIEGKAIEKTNKEGATYKDIYTHRTAENVKQSDGTVIFAPLYIKQPPKKPVYSQVKDMHHHEVVLNPETIKELNIPENIFNYTINKNDAFPYAQFSPTLRGFVGEQTASSRALMSDVVSMTQNHRAAWASVIKSPIKIGKRDKTGVDVVEEGTISKKFDFKTGAYKTIPENEQTTYRIIRAPKTSEIDKLRQLTLSSALIRFTADPANELGLINRQQISRLLTDAYYQKPKVQILHPERGWMESNYSFLSAGSGFLDYPKSTIAIKRLYAPNITKQSRFNLFSDINRAFYGQDFNTGKKFTYDQKQELIKGIDKLTEPEMNTALPRLAKMMQGVDLRMSIFDRVNQTSYNKTLNDYNKLMKSLPEKDVFKKLLDRTKLDYPESKQITFMFDKKLQNSYKRELMSESNPADIIKEFRKADIKDYFHEITPEMNQKQVKEKLDKFVKTTEEFLENSVWEMGGFSRILEIYKDAIKAGQKISDREFSEMFENAEFIKKIDKSNLEQRRILKSSLEETSTASKKNDPEIQVWLDLVNAEKGKAPETTGTKILDQVRIDNAIRDFKNRLSSKYAKDMFDTLLLSSFRNKNVSNQIKNTYESLPYKSEMQKDALRFLYKREGARTGSTRAAFNSREVSSSNIKKFLESMNEFYKQAGKAPKISPKVEKHIEKFEKSKVVELFDPEVRYREILEPEIGNSLIGDIVGMENMRKGKLTPEQSKVVSEFANLIVTDPNFNMEKLNRTLMGLYTYIDPFDPVTKSVDQWNLSDFRRVINTYKEIKQGGVFKHWEKQLPLLKRLSLKARNQMQFPLMVSNEQMAEDIVFMQRKGFLKDWAGKEAKEVDMLYPTSWGEVLQSQIHRMTSMQEAHSARLSNEFMEDINFLNQTKDGMALHNIALAKIELKQRELLDNTELKQAYVQKWEKLRDLYGWRTTASGRTPLFQKDYMLDMDGSGRRSYKGWQVVNHLMKTIESKYEKLFELNSGVFDKIHKDEWNLLSKKEQEKYDDVGNGFYSKHPLVDYTLGYYDKLQTQRRLDVKKFMRDLRTAWAKGPDKALDFALNVGSDGMRQLMRSMAIENLKTEQYIKEIVDKKTGEITEEIISAEEYFNLSKKEQKFYKPDTEKKLKTLEKLIVPETGYRKGYIPHYFNDTKASKEVMMKEQNEIRAKFEKELEGVPLDSKMYKKISNEYVQEMKANFMKYKFQNGDYDLGRNQDYITTLDRMMFKRVKDELAEYETDRLNTANLQSITRRTGNQRSRENHKLDYMMDPVIHGIYIQNATKNLYDTMTNLITRETLHNMHKRNTQKIAENPKWFNKITKEAKKGKEKDYEDALEVVRNWDWFWRQYTREAMGAPSIVSSEAWNNPNLHVSTTPYGWFADNIFANRLNKIGESLNLLNKDKELPKELQQLDNYDVQKIGTLEARFQLATLMTHPKTPINNIFGGTMHTFQSAGYEPLRKAYDYEYLKTINRKFENEEGVIRHLDEHGIQVELAKHELGLDKSLRGIKNEEFIDAVSAKAKGGQEIAKAELEALRKKHGVTKPIMDLAAKFMSIPERRLRRDAYLAHYIKAWERFGGSIKNPDSPILIELAKKGVKATQFLYSAPFRPAFARSALGKTMTRFQLWAWNAVRFRNDVRKLAKRYGYKPGSEGMKKFERMMTTDLFVMALGSLFMYSMFEQTIPAPYGWIQDTAQWVFGDEKERDRAFFGTYPSAIAPLQMITPPIARFPISIIREFAEDDYTKLADYYIWTMFPFGRMGRDLLHPEQNIFKNPMRIPEKVFGFPLTGFSQHAKRMREENYEPITPGKSIDIF